MSIERIVDRVRQDSKAAEQAILREAAAYRNAEIAKANGRRDEILEGYRAKADRAIAQLRAREEAGLEMELKKRALASRKRILDAAFERLLGHFSDLPNPQKKRIYDALMSKASKDVPRGRVRAVKGEDQLFSGYSYAKGPNISGAGGFILESEDGRMQMDMRFEVLLAELWDRNLGEISAMLFAKGGGR